MRLPGVTSIRRRLLALSAAISVLTLAIAGTLFVINDVAMLRQQMARDLEVLSVVVGDNSLSALDFDAPETAAKNLASLRREYQIRYAALYDAAGRRFASYQRDAAEPVPEPMLEPAQAGDGVFVNVSPLGLGSIEVVRTLSLRGQPIGRIFIHARTDELAAQLKRYALIVALLLVSTLTISLLLAWRLQRRVSEPILELAAKTQTVSEHADYSLRVTPPDDDGELGILYRGFNAMLAQIERRDTALTDIRERLEQRVEERTRDLNAVVREQRLIVETLPLGIIHLVEDRRIARANPRAAELFGMRLEEMIGRSTADFYPEPAAFEEVGRVGYAQMAAGGIFRDDRVLQRRDGRRFWGRLIGQYIDPNNEALGSIWIVDDIDRDKALEERLRQAREAAEAANRAKDLFMANMSHELRTPLNAVLGFAQLLAGDARLLPEQREQVQGIRRGGERLLGLISELLDLARIEAGRLTLEPVPWDSAALLAELAGMFEARARYKGIGLEIADADTLPPRLRCDSKRLHQVLANLIDNAIKFTDSGRVRVAAGFADDMLMFEVRDTGVGMSAADIARIFERFRQVGDAQQHARGTGLGLAISKRLVERMGGVIEVESRPGAGSRFRVRVPAERLPVLEDAAPTPADPGAIIGYRRTTGGQDETGVETGVETEVETGTLRILIVDDEPENREVLRGLLAPLGFEVRDAEDGADCIAQATALAPDLILMDLRMPDMDGLAATRALRQRPACSDIPIVAVTAAAFDADQGAAFAAGCNAHLPKPVLREALLKTLAELLPRTWTRAEPRAGDDCALDVEALPPARLAELATLVRTGNVTGISALAQALARDGCCPALARHLSSLADAFDIVGLRRLIASGDRVRAKGPDTGQSPTEPEQ